MFSHFREPQKMQSFKKHILKRFPYLINSGVLVACSGGLDSLALLYLINSIKEELGIRLSAAYINHNLRPDTEKEADFIRNICEKMAVPFFCGEIGRSFWEANEGNMEERARKERYRLLAEIAESNQYKYIATAHHADDQVETMLMRIFDRGTGIRGLVGIKEIIKGEGSDIVRPFLIYHKKEIHNYMKDKEYLVDPTNELITIRRNFYRKEVIPVLNDKLGEQYKKHLLSLSNSIAGDLGFADSLAITFWKNFSTKSECYEIHRKFIDLYSDDFWMSAFSNLFSKERGFSHSSDTLFDLVNFIRKKEKSSCTYHPFIISRGSELVVLTKIVTQYGKTDIDEMAL